MRIEPLAVPTGAAALGVLPRLALALEGGRPIAPYAAGSPPPVLPPHDAAGLPRDLAVVVGTSGSTGTPKLAMLGTHALRASIDATHARLSGPGQWLLTMPAHHIAGLQVLFRSLVGGTTPHVMDLSDGFTPTTWISTVDSIPTTNLPTYVSLVPTQLTRLLPDDEATQRLAQFDAVLVGGAATHPDLLARATAAGITAVTTYGMSETAGGCVYDGQPLDGTEVLLDQDGRIHLAGDTIAHGYLGDPARTAAAFPDRLIARLGTRRCAPPAHTGNKSMDGTAGRVFLTDDLGRLGDDGRLHVDGRVDDLVNTGGLKVAPRLVEEAVARLDGIAEAVAVGIPDPEWGEAVAVAVVRESTEGGSAPDRVLTVSGLREQLRGILADHALPRAVREVPTIPTRGPGKPDRAAIRELFIRVGE